MSIVLDTSVIISWYMPDEINHTTNILVDYVIENDVFVPSLLIIEAANALSYNLKRNRITYEQMISAISQINELQLSIEYTDHTTVFNHVLPLAQKHNLTVYDAIYLELAKRKKCYLATLDKELGKAAINEGVKLWEF